MPSTLDLCEKYFGTRDVYKLLGITKDALEKDVKKAYYKLSLKVHPDRVPENEKEVSTEKFKVLARINQVLTDKNKKALYDEQAVIDDDEVDDNAWLELWRNFFKPISTEDIDNYQKEYVGSEMEKTDIKKAYLGGKGCINHMLNSVPFMEVEDESRVKDIVGKMIDDKEVPEYKIFTNEPKDKKNRRHKKYAREKREAEQIKAKMENSNEGSLEQQIMKKQQERSSMFGTLMEKLMEKYGNDDDSEDFDAADLAKKKKQPKKSTSTSKGNKKTVNGKTNDRKVRNGKVSKK